LYFLFFYFFYFFRGIVREHPAAAGGSALSSPSLQLRKGGRGEVGNCACYPSASPSSSIMFNFLRVQWKQFDRKRKKKKNKKLEK
jgi:hypothetical protein